MFCFSSIAAIAAEKKIQRDTIRKQRDDYIRRASALKRELIVLKEQREELISGNEPPSPTTHSFVKENDRLQVKYRYIHPIRLGLVVLQHFLHFVLYNYKLSEVIHSQSFVAVHCASTMTCVLVSELIYYFSFLLSILSIQLHFSFDSFNFPFHLFHKIIATHKKKTIKQPIVLYIQ